MTAEERKKMALKLLKEVEDIVVTPGCENLKEDMANVLISMAENLTKEEI